jgi:hypothetical protein
MMSTIAHGLSAVTRKQEPMDDAQADRAAFDTAERLLGAPLVLPLGPIHLEAYAGAARAFDSYQIALEVFAETAGTE